MNIEKHKKYKKQYERDQRTNNSFPSFYRKALQDNLIDGKGYETLCRAFTTYKGENMIPFGLFLKKNKKFFCSNKTIKVHMAPL